MEAREGRHGGPAPRPPSALGVFDGVSVATWPPPVCVADRTEIGCSYSGSRQPHHPEKPAATGKHTRREQSFGDRHELHSANQSNWTDFTIQYFQVS